MAAARRRRAAFHLGRFRLERRSPAPAGFANVFAAGPRGAPGEYVHAGRSADEQGQGTGNKRPGIRRAETDKGPDVHALFVYNSNPAAVAPNHNAVRRGLERADLFTVVHDLFFTDTTDYADYVLPATTFLEHTDLQGAYGHYFVQLSQQAIDPPGEARSNVWLFGQLGQRMGFAEPCFRDTAEEMIEQALAIGPDGHSRNAGMEHITLDAAEEAGPRAARVSLIPRRAVSALRLRDGSYALRQN